MRINVRVSSDFECLWWRALLLSDNNNRVNPELERLEKLLPMLSQMTELHTFISLCVLSLFIHYFIIKTINKFQTPKLTSEEMYLTIIIKLCNIK